MKMIDIIKKNYEIFKKRNVFFNKKSGEVIGVTKRGKTILSLYYYNSKMFRYGIYILILCDIFIVFLRRLYVIYKN